MNQSSDLPCAGGSEPTPQLRDTRAAFDSVAGDYDGRRGNNELIQDMRSEMWRWLDATFAAPSRLLDLGCGTGLDAVRMASMGHRVTAADWSPMMARRTEERATEEHLRERIEVLTLGAQELDRLQGESVFDGIYSNLGPLNCVPDLTAVAQHCARLLRPGGALVFTVIGRFCPWEVAHYLRRRQWQRIKIRFARGIVPVSMNNHTIWTRYYSPREFFRSFGKAFELEHYRGLGVFAPPPYLTAIRDRRRATYDFLWRLDRRVAGWPVLRALGDHFLLIMRKR